MREWQSQMQSAIAHGAYDDDSVLPKVSPQEIVQSTRTVLLYSSEIWRNYLYFFSNVRFFVLNNKTFKDLSKKFARYLLMIFY